MGVRGIRIDLERLTPLGAWVEGQIVALKAELKQHAVYRAFLKEIGEEDINISSPPQKQKLVFQYLGLVPDKKSRKTGNPSCDGDFLEYHQDEHPILKTLLRWAELQKLESSFISTLPDLSEKEPDGKHGILHPWWRIGGARTWRISSADPNLQNQPKVPEIRRCFVPRPGYLFVEGDLSQAEPRIIASLADEPLWIEAFKEGRDIYREIYKATKKVTEVSDSQRQWAKTLLLAVSYGLSPTGASQKLGLSVVAAKDLITDFFKGHKKIAQWKKEREEEATRTLQVVAPHGKIRRFNADEVKEAHAFMDSGDRELERKGFGILNGILRQAVNFTPQSLCGHLTLEIMRRAEKKYPACKIVVQVHDSILWEVPRNEYREYVPLLKAEMEDGSSYRWLKVPLKADIKVGEDWGDMQKCQ